MKALALAAVVAGTGLVIAGGATDALRSPSEQGAAAVYAAPAPVLTNTATSASSTPIAPATLTEVVQRYCVTCHNDQLLTGSVSFQSLDVERAAEKPELVERMIRKLRVGMMPPPGMPRPGGDTLQCVLLETLESKVDAAAKTAPHLGERRFQRLSRKEYERVVKDLLTLDVDAGKWLPADFYNAGFDNQSAAQQFSPTLLDSFLRAAAEVARMAVGNPTAVSTTAKYVNNDRISQHAWARLEGAPFGTRGGQVVTHDFPADAEYIFQIKTNQGTGSGPPIDDIDISIDGEPVALVKLEFHGGQQLSSATQQGSGFDAAIDRAITTEPIFVRAGQHRVSAAFVNRIDGPYEDRFSPVDWSSVGNASFEYGTTGLTHVTELWVTGPRNVTGISDTSSRQRVFICRPKSAAEERPCAEEIFKNLATQAYRRPVTTEDVADLLGFYDEAAAKDGFEVGVRMGLQAILLSPDFWFRLEREPAGTAEGQTLTPSDVELATRLSFFLWATGPDQELLDVATRGRLSNPGVLEQQVKRMLQDPRADALATRFAHQWLMLQDVGRVWPQGYLYADFTRQLADDLVRETEMFFEHLVREDRSMLELFSADYTFLNQRLAQHYGIPGVSGEEMRLVKYPADSNRRGVLSHGSILQLTSVSERTSPVLRGKYVMTVIMGTPPPAPPPNVPPFEASPTGAGGRRLTTRERMEMHRTSAVCNSCHRFMDPIGLALDNFDVAGRWRIRENMAALDTRGVFYDGTRSKPTELVDVLLKRPVPLVRQFTVNLMAYALGRGVEYYDQPTIRAITQAAEKDGYRLSSLIMGVVKSDAFLKKQAQTTN